MNDPLHQSPPPPLFSTSQQAGARAAQSVGNRKLRILRYIQEHGPSTLFEVAAALELAEHQISGRFTELSQEGLIEPSGEQRAKPETGCMATVWKIAGERIAFDASRREDLHRAGFPDEIFIANERFELQPPAPTESLPGIPYQRNDGKGLFELWRLDVIQCPGCSKPLKFFTEPSGAEKLKKFRCLTPGCNRTWELTVFNQSGQTPVLALVMKHL